MGTVAGAAVVAGPHPGRPGRSTAWGYQSRQPSDHPQEHPLVREFFCLWPTHSKYNHYCMVSEHSECDIKEVTVN